MLCLDEQCLFKQIGRCAVGRGRYSQAWFCCDGSGGLVVAEFLITLDQHLDDDLHLHGKLGGNLSPLLAVDLHNIAHDKAL